MNMPNRMTKLFPVLTAVLAFGFLPKPAFSQTPGGRTALAAKQRLKNEVLDAMSDGKITRLERAEILAEAKENLTVKEYEGLKATMDRLSPPESANRVPNVRPPSARSPRRCRIVPNRRRSSAAWFRTCRISTICQVRSASASEQLGQEPSLREIGEHRPFRREAGVGEGAAVERNLPRSADRRSAAAQDHAQ